jgi:transposase
MRRNQDEVRRPAVTPTAGLPSLYRWIPASRMLTPEANHASTRDRLAQTRIAGCSPARRTDRRRSSRRGSRPDSRTEGSISKQGNKYLRTAVVQGAWRAVHQGNDPYLSRFYHRLRDQKNKPEKVARVATGRKLLVSIFHMLTREEEYDPPTG